MRVLVHSNTLDDGHFDEGKVKRDDKGKFAKKVNAIITTPTLKEHGFKKSKETKAGHLASYEHPSNGLKVHIHMPPEGQTSSSKYTSEGVGFSPKTGTGVQLKTLLESHSKRSAKPEPVSKPLASVNSAEQYKKDEIAMSAAIIHLAGFKKGPKSFETQIYGNGDKYENSDAWITHNEQEGNWAVVNKNGDSVVSGKSGENQKLKDYIEATKKLPHPVDHPAQAEAPTIPVNEHEFNYGHVQEHKKALEPHGYVFSPGNDDTKLLFKKSDGSGSAELQFTKEADGSMTWTASHSKFPNKYGTTLEQAALLASGKPSSQIPGVSMSPISSPSVNPSSLVPGQDKPWNKNEHKIPNTYVGAHVVDINKLSEQAPSPSAEESGAIKTYSGSSYSSINSGLRQGLVTKGYGSIVSGIDSYMDKASFKQPTVLFRGIKSDYANGLVAHGIGTEWIDHGYSSHTTSQDIAKQFAGGGAMLVVHVPKGAKGASINHISQHGNELEVLFKRASRFKITKIDGANRHIHVEMII